VQDPPAGLRGHPLPKAVLAPARDSFRLVRPFRHTDTFRKAVGYPLSAVREALTAKATRH
jgi:hypothetical protein